MVELVVQSKGRFPCKFLKIFPFGEISEEFTREMPFGQKMYFLKGWDGPCNTTKLHPYMAHQLAIKGPPNKLEAHGNHQKIGQNCKKSSKNIAKFLHFL